MREVKIDLTHMDRLHAGDCIKIMQHVMGKMMWGFFYIDKVDWENYHAVRVLTNDSTDGTQDKTEFGGFDYLDYEYRNEFNYSGGWMDYLGARKPDLLPIRAYDKYLTTNSNLVSVKKVNLYPGAPLFGKKAPFKDKVARVSSDSYTPGHVSICLSSPVNYRDFDYYPNNYSIYADSYQHSPYMDLTLRELFDCFEVELL